MSTLSTLTNEREQTEFLTLVKETIPREIFWTYPALYLHSGCLPSTLSQDPALLTCYSVNPQTLILASPKHNHPVFNRYLLAYQLDASKFDLYLSPYGLSGQNYRSFHANFRLAAARREESYRLQYKALRSALWIKYIPGVKKIYLTGSSVLAAARPTSDADLIIEAWPHWVWVVRFWVKVFLKLRAQDVFRLRFQILRWLNPTRHNLEVARYKNRLGYKLDIGLVTVSWPDFRDKYLPKAPYTLFFYEAEELHVTTGICGYSPQSSIVKGFWRGLHKILFLLSLLLYPVIWLWARAYIYLHRNSPRFIVTWDDLCFYPLYPIIHGKLHL